MENEKSTLIRKLIIAVAILAVALAFLGGFIVGKAVTEHEINNAASMVDEVAQEMTERVSECISSAGNFKNGANIEACEDKDSAVVKVEEDYVPRFGE